MTVSGLRVRGTSTTELQSHPPVLNPLDSVMNKMKYLIQEKCPDLGEERERSSREIREIIEEALEFVSFGNPLNLILTILVRC